MRKSLHTKAQKVLQEALVAARKAAGLSQHQLAVRLRKPQSFIAKYERGERRLDLIEFLVIVRQLNGDTTDIIEQVAAAAE